MFQHLFLREQLQMIPRYETGVSAWSTGMNEEKCPPRLPYRWRIHWFLLSHEKCAQSRRRQDSIWPVCNIQSPMEAPVSFLDSDKNLTMLHEAIKTGVHHPHLLLLQTAHILIGWKKTPGMGPGKSKQRLWWGMVSWPPAPCRCFWVPFRELSPSVLSGRNFTPQDLLIYYLCVWFSSSSTLI